MPREEQLAGSTEPASESRSLGGQTILLIEDSVDVIAWTSRVLEEMGAKVCVATSLALARAMLTTESFALAIVDVELPDGRGTALVREIRDAGRVPMVIVFSAHAFDDDVVEGLVAGADDYIGKPVAARVLSARIEAVQRRLRLPSPVAHQRLSLHLNSGQLEGPDGSASLTRKESDLMMALLAVAPALVPRESILKDVWGYDFDPGTSVLDVTLTRLRAKLERVDRSARIVSQRDRGVQLATE